MQKNTKVDVEPEILEIRSSGISGKGSFAARYIKRGEFIIALAGEAIVTQDVEPHCAGLGISGDDPLQIGDKVFLILDYKSKTINHSCQPNAGIRYKSELYAVRDIQAGEEITYDYSTTSGILDKWTMNCGCHANGCRQTIGNVLSIPSETLDHYLNLNVLPDYIKLQLKLSGRL
ncbi:hypothetical protein AQUSIP_19020 [Aquicella siphonis]|uniref:SET domain-containing protein n=1 Tax=Aquicella siphonis TaxID=254247 RepID=A0A5E4PJ36_9COXI|nr:SET domain-containing protein [Aquicella siphonis]VVC76585.1 hypothetical protein AQUSIP_19020 [Aquicella siphonis]